jgi:hypothetical protein
LSVARDGVGALREVPDAELTRILRERLVRGSGWRRDLSRWVLARWRDETILQDVERLSIDPAQDPSGLAIWCRARYPPGAEGAALARAYLTELETRPGSSELRRAHLLMAAYRLDRARTMSVLEKIRGGDPQLRVKSLAQLLLEHESHRDGEPGSRAILLDLVPLVPFQCSGLRLAAGEALLVRRWGFHEDPGTSDGYQNFGGITDIHETAANVVLRPLGRGPVLGLSSKWRPYLARADTRFLVGLYNRVVGDPEIVFEGLLHGLIVLEVILPADRAILASDG